MSCAHLSGGCERRLPDGLVSSVLVAPYRVVTFLGCRLPHSCTHGQSRRGWGDVVLSWDGYP
ncbi:hypothetical protein GCM10025867_46670 (plasmid) [Frondihabitans sucicola]|uniref:Uncharacterized protein n=1 Tax=Frondihabitans sucicola TaxID=1268041 RepID=A0ABN6Y8W0_9MICO|nr:hypothetical protein GCM10025867_46670 [Frondihabitans sucicola]